MLGNFPPFTTMQELNLDWILTKIKNILRFVPDDGAVGQILRRTRSGAEWSDEQGAGGSVTSVNGMQGAVVLDAADVGALPDTYVAPVTSVNGMTGDVVISGGAVDSVNGQTGAVVLDAADVGALPDNTPIPDSTSDLVNDSGFITSAQAPVQSVNGQTGAVVLGKSDVGLGNVDNVQQYSASNPPPYPVTSVNGQTGSVGITYTNPHTLTGFASGEGFKSVLSDLTDTLSVGQFIPVYANLSSITLTPFYQTYYSGFISKLSANRSWGLMSDAFGVLVLLTENDNVWTFTSK